MLKPNVMEEDALQTNIYCWKCAKDTNINLRCTKCPRHFHDTCVNNRSETDWICDECSKKDYFECVTLQQFQFMSEIRLQFFFVYFSSFLQAIRHQIHSKHFGFNYCK